MTTIIPLDLIVPGQHDLRSVEILQRVMAVCATLIVLTIILVVAMVLVIGHVRGNEKPGRGPRQPKK